MRVTSYNGPAALMVVTACNEENGNGLHRISSLDRPNGRCAYPRTAGLLDDLTHTAFHSVILLGRLGVLFFAWRPNPASMHRHRQLLRPTLRALQRVHGLVIGQGAEPHVVQILEGYKAHVLALVAGRSEEHVWQRRDWREG